MKSIVLIALVYLIVAGTASATGCRGAWVNGHFVPTCKGPTKTPSLTPTTVTATPSATLTPEPSKAVTVPSGAPATGRG